MPRPNDSFLDWLDALLKAKQPLVHYQVLGLKLFEDDPQKIRQAVQRQIKALWTYAHGPYAHRVRRGRHLVDQASRHLLNPRLKAAYDAQLRKSLAVPAVTTQEVSIRTVDMVGEHMAKAEQNSNRSLVIGSVSAFACLAAALLIAFWPGGFGRTKPAADASTVPVPHVAPVQGVAKTPVTLASSSAPVKTAATGKTAPATTVAAPITPPPPAEHSSSARLIVGEKTIEVFPESVAARNEAPPAPPEVPSVVTGEATKSTGPPKAVELPPVPKMTGPATSLWKSAISKVRAVAVSPEGRSLVTGGGDRTVRLWDMETGKEIRRFAGHQDGVNDVAIRGDGSQIASCGADGRVLVWSIKGEDEPQVFEGHQGAVQRVAFLHKSGKLVTAGTDQTIRTWNLASGQEEISMKGNDRWMTLAVSPDDEHVLVGGRDGTLVMWSISTGKAESSFEGHQGALHSVAFLGDGARILSAAWDGTVRLWDTETTAELERFEGAGTGQASLVVSPNSERFAVGGEDGRISLWDIATRRQLATYDGHRERVARIAFQIGTGAMISAGWDDAVRYWQTP